jgi:anti-sigma factor RsiW
MKPEQLETLLLDRALNQLAPEVADLLEAHLAHDPAAARRVAALAATVALARETAAPPREPAAAVGAAAWQRVQRTWRWRMAGLETLKVAASVAVGLGVAFLWHNRVPSPAQGFAVAVPLAVVQPAPAFWSSTRLIAAARRDAGRVADDSNHYQPRWLTPAKQTQVEGKP